MSLTMEEVSVSSESVGGSDENAMDIGVSSQEQMDGIEGNDTYKTEDLKGEAAGDDNSAKSCVLKMLDEMDRRVEKLRADALKVEAERDDVLASLDALNNSQLVYTLGGIELDEVTRYIKRLAQRSAAIKIEISTERSVPQQESLHAVNTLIDALIREVKTDVAMARRRCSSYLNSCLDITDTMYQESCGIDAPFELAVLGCTLEDQKRVKKRLNGLNSYFATYSPSLSEIKEEEEEDVEKGACALTSS
ncbi:BAG family molecular chaperone regulator 2 [Orchesella cincta]|uniref:BAG family molecular chaperone regulator 2 n=1 Tax=Orchesella cincta TaxID=48709 RepID=A0A1D2NB37_ORCCI|nr:BAG family molecular chaperone regulator 2 [Orchesella cincta]